MEKAENISQGSTKGQHTTLRGQDGGGLNTVRSGQSLVTLFPELPIQILPRFSRERLPSARDFHKKMCVCTHMQELLLGTNWKHPLPWCCPWCMWRFVIKWVCFLYQEKDAQNSNHHFVWKTVVPAPAFPTPPPLIQGSTSLSMRIRRQGQSPLRPPAPHFL